MRKNKLLSIGELSKLTGASLRSLRYYEKIGILKPTHIDPDSGYRYYSIRQVNLVWIIMFCIELDIPLKELPRFSDTNDIMDFKAFLAEGKEIAQKKLKTIRRWVKLTEKMEQWLDLAEAHPLGDIYEKELSEKFFFVKPFEKPLEQIDQYEIIASFSDMPYPYDNYIEFPEAGVLLESTPAGVSCYIFMEVPKQMANKKIPAGTYLCRQSENDRMEQPIEVFPDYLAEQDSYLAIVTEVFRGTFKLGDLINELRVIRF